MKRNKFLKRLKRINPNNIAAVTVLIMVSCIVLGVVHYAIQDFKSYIESHVIIIYK